MLLSQYNFLFQFGDEFYIYNSLSNSLISIDQESFLILSSASDSKEEFDCKKLDDDLVEILLKNNMLTESHEDDFLVYKSVISKIRAERDSMHVTIAPTMDCHFRCHYCFEKFKKSGTMTENVMDNIVQYISMQKDLKSLHITWFGGEPLMAVKEIECFNDKLKDHISNIKFTSDIITTAYDISEETINILKKVQVSSMQITIDGNRETHNKIKCIKGEDVFERIMNNIELINDKFPELHIVIRVNLTKKNAHEYPTLVNYMMKRFYGRTNINPTPAFIVEKDVRICNECNSNLFSHTERSEYVLRLFNSGYDSPYVRYPKRVMSECAIRNDLAVAFDPKGYMYKCWEVIGDESYAIGLLEQNGKITKFNQKVYNRQVYGADPLDDPKCRKCKYLPICNGGCPIQRIQNEFDGCKNNYCTHYKGYMEEFLKIHIARKKQEKENAKKIKIARNDNFI